MRPPRVVAPRRDPTSALARRRRSARRARRRHEQDPRRQHAVARPRSILFYEAPGRCVKARIVRVARHRRRCCTQARELGLRRGDVGRLGVRRSDEEALVIGDGRLCVAEARLRLAEQLQDLRILAVLVDPEQLVARLFVVVRVERRGRLVELGVRNVVFVGVNEGKQMRARRTVRARAIRASTASPLPKVNALEFYGRAVETPTSMSGNRIKLDGDAAAIEALVLPQDGDLARGGRKPDAPARSGSTSARLATTSPLPWRLARSTV